MSFLETVAQEQVFSLVAGKFIKDDDATVFAVKSALLDVLNARSGLSPVELSTVGTDFEYIVLQLQRALGEYQTWQDILTAGTGQSVIRFLATILTFAENSIQRAVQETTEHARLPSSRYANARGQGVRITRKVPARVEALLANKNPKVFTHIPAYTLFTVGGKSFFNREPYIFNVGDVEALAVRLYQGTPTYEEYTSNGEPFQQYLIGPENFSVSNDDLICTVAGVEWARDLGGPWLLGENAEVFYENTTPQGNVEVRFHNTIYGKIPPVNNLIKFLYVVTDGAAANSSISEQAIVLKEFPNIEGTTTSAIVAGSDEKDSEFYATMGPHLFAARGRAVTRVDYLSTVMAYPGVIDVRVRAQAEVAPDDKDWMNIFTINMLTQFPFDDVEWEKLLAYLDTKGIYKVNAVREDPFEVEASVSAVVYCQPGANLETIKRDLTKKLQALFKHRRGWIGTSVYLNDIHDVLRGEGNTYKQISHVTVESPGADLIIGDIEYLTLTDIDLDVKFRNISQYTVTV